MIKYFNLLFLLLPFTIQAYDFKAQDKNGTTWYFDWVEPGITCQLADRNDVRSEYNPNAKSWESPYNIIYIPTNTVVTSSNAWSMPVENTLNWGNNTIPEEITTTYNGKTVPVKVIGIGKYCFAIGGYIQGAPKIPSSIEYIGEGAFLNMNQYGEIDLSHVKSIGKLAFCYSGLSGVNIESIEYLGDYAFYQAGAIDYIKLGDNCQYIGDYAFYNCSNLTELNIPGTCKYVGDYSFYHCEKICPLTLNEGIEEIGAYAFYQAKWDCSHVLELPASLKKIGVWAFMFNRTADVRETDTDITDINIRSTNPPELPVDENGHCAFGDFDPNLSGFWDVDGMWMYPYLCLHVPAGTYLDYKNHKYWGKFSCIMDDLIPDEPEAQPGVDPDPLKYVVNYIYLLPGDEISLSEYVDIEELLGKSETISWEEINNECLEVDSKGNVKAKQFGNDIAIALRSNQIYENGNGWVDAGKSIAGAVVIFVCPIVTVVYDKGSVTDEVTSAKKVRALGPDNSTEIDNLVSENTTYSHPVVYNSFPKVQVNPSPSVEIELIERAKVDGDNAYIDNDQLKELKEEEGELELSGNYEGAVLPVDPVQENRVIVVTLANTYSLPGGPLSDVKDVEISSDITVSVSGNVVTVKGAADQDVVDIYDTNGRKVYSSAEKTFQLQHHGVFVATVGDAAFKIIVK